MRMRLDTQLLKEVTETTEDAATGGGAIQLTDAAAVRVTGSKPPKSTGRTRPRAQAEASPDSRAHSTGGFSDFRTSLGREELPLPRITLANVAHRVEAKLWEQCSHTHLIGPDHTVVGEREGRGAVGGEFSLEDLARVGAADHFEPHCKAGETGDVAIDAAHHGVPVVDRLLLLFRRSAIEQHRSAELIEDRLHVLARADLYGEGLGAIDVERRRRVRAERQLAHVLCRVPSLPAVINPGARAGGENEGDDREGCDREGDADQWGKGL